MNNRTRNGRENREEDDSKTQDPSISSLLIGYILVFSHALCMTISSVSVQALRNEIPHFELVLVRFITLTAMTACTLLCKKDSPQVPGGLRSWIFLLVTALINVTTFTIYYESSYYIPLGPVGGVFRGTTLVMSVLLARLILKEIITCLKMAALVGCILGVVFIICPAILSSKMDEGNTDVKDIVNTATSLRQAQSLNPVQLLGANDTNIEGVLGNISIDRRLLGEDRNIPIEVNGQTSNSVPLWLQLLGYVLTIIAGAVNSTEMIVLVYYLNHVRSIVQSFWFGVVGTVLSFLVLSYTEDPTLPQSTHTLLILCIHGVAAALSNLTFISTLKYLPASNTAITQSVHVAMMYIAQWTLMKQWNHDFFSLFNMLQMLGTGLILVFVLLLPVTEICRYQLLRRYKSQV